MGKIRKWIEGFQASTERKFGFWEWGGLCMCLGYLLVSLGRSAGEELGARELKSSIPSLMRRDIETAENLHTQNKKNQLTDSSLDLNQRKPQ